MKNVIIYTNENGGVAICIPTGELPIEQVQTKDIPTNVKSYIVEIDALPEDDNDFFDAWEQSMGIITINIDKAKELTKRRLRIEREPLLLAQDIKFQQAQETGSDVSTIVIEKNRLRNITTQVDSCSSTSELRTLKVAL